MALGLVLVAQMGKPEVENLLEQFPLVRRLDLASPPGGRSIDFIRPMARGTPEEARWRVDNRNALSAR
jgi:hypothetical protein